jgi:hypothetical protein
MANLTEYQQGEQDYIFLLNQKSSIKLSHKGDRNVLPLINLSFSKKRNLTTDRSGKIYPLVHGLAPYVSVNAFGFIPGEHSSAVLTMCPTQANPIPQQK